MTSLDRKPSRGGDETAEPSLWQQGSLDFTADVNNPPASQQELPSSPAARNESGTAHRAFWPDRGRTTRRYARSLFDPSPTPGAAEEEQVSPAGAPQPKTPPSTACSSPIVASGE